MPQTPHGHAHRLGGIDLPQKAVEALRIHPKRQLEEPHKVSANWQDYGLVFTSSKGTPLDAQNIVDRRWHDLRHTCAPLPLSRGVHPKYIQQSLGHTSIQLTHERHSYWMSSMGTNTADGMNEELDRATYSGPSLL
jgi:integrase